MELKVLFSLTGVGNKPERGIGETHSARGACLRRQGSDLVGSAATFKGP